MADEVKITEEIKEAEVKEAEEIKEEVKEEAKEEVKEEAPKKEKVKKEKKPRKPFFFDTAKTTSGLIGRCALIIIHTLAIAYVLLWLFGGLEMLINSNPQTFSFVYPFTTAAMHGLIAAIIAAVYGIARIACVVVQYKKKK